MGPPEANVDDYLSRLRELPFVRDAKAIAAPQTRASLAPDFVIKLMTPSGPVNLFAELKGSHLPADVASRLPFAREGSKWILLAPHIGAPVGQSLEEKGINFIDRQGNCYLRIGKQHVARVQGRRAPKAEAQSKGLRAPGYQVLFALLAAPELVEQPVRAIAAAAGVSRQPVVDVLARLVEEGHLVHRDRKHAWVEAHRARLFDRWLAGYQSTVRPSLHVGRFRLPAKTAKETEKYLESHVTDLRYGGTAAAFKLDRHYRGPNTIIHVEPTAELRRTLRAVPSEDGALIWLRPMGSAAMRGETSDTVHPLLVYSELMSDRDPRAREAAARLREKWLPWSL